MNIFTKLPFIHYSKQKIDQDDIDSVIEVLKSDFLTTGPKIAEFENVISKFTNSKYTVVVSNGTAALHTACFAANIKAGDEVITTPMTFAASSNCILYMGATPIFADIDKNTLNINPNEIEKKITKKTKAIIPVHFAGVPCQLDEINYIAKKYNLIIIEDGAHAFGAKYNNIPIGSISDMTTFSFHPVKSFTTGEGGAICTNSEDLYKKLLLFRNHGITRTNDDMIINSEPSWYYEQQFLGYNYRLTDIQAALGISQIKKFHNFLDRRKEIVKKYNLAFQDVNEIITPIEPKNTIASWHIYVIRLKNSLLKITRNDLFKELHKRNIGANLHYIPVYRHPYYKELGYKESNYPVCEKIYNEILTLPLHQSLTDNEIDYIINSVKDIIK